MEDLKQINEELNKDQKMVDFEYKLLFDPNEHGKARDKRIYTLDPLSID